MFGSKSFVLGSTALGAATLLPTVDAFAAPGAPVSQRSGLRGTTGVLGRTVSTPSCVMPALLGAAAGAAVAGSMAGAATRGAGRKQCTSNLVRNLSKEQQLGAEEPLRFWDPLDLCKDEASSKDYRAKELQHGRAAMMGAVGILGQSLAQVPGTEEVQPSVERVPILKRVDTLGVESLEGSFRDGLLSRVHMDNVREVSIDAGQTGSVYALQAGGEKIAVFKPAEGERFHRKGLKTGKGSVREEAVYLVDRIAGHQASVPVTSRASVAVGSAEMQGSVQAFVPNVLGFVEDFAMPRGERAQEFVRQETAEALALLDMRVFNMDRHTGNLLLLGHGKPHGLGPIDHGCCLPPWWRLGEANFDAWSAWPQLQSAPCEATRDTARRAADSLPRARDALRDMGLDAESILTLRVCTLFVRVGVAELGLPCGRIAKLMLRDEDTDFQELSWLEARVLASAVAAGGACRMEVDDRGDQELVPGDDGGSLHIESFLAGLEEVFRAEMSGAVGA